MIALSGTDRIITLSACSNFLLNSVSIRNFMFSKVRAYCKSQKQNIESCDHTFLKIWQISHVAYRKQYHILPTTLFRYAPYLIVRK